MTTAISLPRLSPTPARRNAFTLLETLLALGLSSALIVALFGLAGSTAQYQVTGRDLVTTSQEHLGLLQDMRFDLRSISSESLPSANQTARKFATHIEEQFLNTLRTNSRLNDELPLEPLELYGKSKWLVLTTDSSNPRFQSPLEERRHEKHCVLWSFSSDLPQNVPTGVRNMELYTQQVVVPKRSGLLRIMLNTRAKRPGSVVDNLVHSMEAVSAVSFRYFDGEQWKDEWNSFKRKSLPLAIQVEVTWASSQLNERWCIQLPQASPVGRASEKQP